MRAVDDRAEIVGACVGAGGRTVRLSSPGGEWAFRMTDADDPAAGTAEVDVVTMDGLLESTGIGRIGLLKCDIEGAEAELFADCRSWIDRVDAMYVECHDHAMPTDALLAALSANGARFSVRHVARNPQLGFEIVTLVRRDGRES